MSMRKLLRAVETALRKQLDPGIYRTVDIFITTAQLGMPDGVRLPAIGIKDGSRTVEQLTCNVDQSTMQVDLVLWAAKGQGDAQVMGNAAQPGVLRMEEHVESVLRGDDLGVAVDGGRLIRSAPSSELSDKEVGGKIVQVRIATFEYTLEKQWPID